MGSVVRVSQIHSQRVERYELLTELAAGGMATVFLARLGGAGGFQRLYAIKRLHPHLAHEREFVEMFLDEARLAARIHHPNVVPILEVGTSDVGYYLVMEYIEGETLARLLGRTASNGGQIPIRIGVKIVLDTLAGLEAAHGLQDDFGRPLNIVHRDVSPQNIMVGVDGTARITDFGVARAATRLTTTRAGQLKGKLGYMAPEHAQGEVIDLRADVFATGVILWETLTGRRLFKGSPDAPDAQVLKRLLYEPIPNLVEMNPAIPPVFVPICERALERDPSRRFSSCGEFADALEQATQKVDGIASIREVASFVDSVAGPEIKAQREAVRNWVARSEVGCVARFEPQDELPRSTPFELRSSSKRPYTAEQTAPQPTSRIGLIVGGAIASVLAVGVGAASLYSLSTRPSVQASPQHASVSNPIATASDPPRAVDTVAEHDAPAASGESASCAPSTLASAVEPPPVGTSTARNTQPSDRNDRTPPPKQKVQSQEPDTTGTDPSSDSTSNQSADEPLSDDLNINPYR